MQLKEKFQGKLTAREDKEMKISQSDFVNLLLKMKQRDDKMNKVADGLEELIDGYACININSEVDTAIISLLETLTGDTDEIISWWLYEDVEKVITITPESSINCTNEDVLINIETLEELYEYLQYFS